jgi:hypothetical protein
MILTTLYTTTKGIKIAVPPTMLDGIRIAMICRCQDKDPGANQGLVDHLRMPFQTPLQGLTLVASSGINRCWRARASHTGATM